MRTQDKGNRFVIVDKVTDKIKAQEQIDRSSFITLNHDPTESHIQSVKEWAEKWYKSEQISKEWMDYVINVEAQPGKNSVMYKTHKPGNPVRLLTSGVNTAIEKLARFIESVCAPLTEKLPSRIKNTSHLLDIIDNINENGVPDDAILVSFDIVNMFPSIDNENGIRAITSALDKRDVKFPSTECVIEGLQICLYKNNSIFADSNLLQTNGTATGAPNSCSYADMAVSAIDDAVFRSMEVTYPELKYFGRYRDDCFSIWIGSVERLNEFFEFMNSLSSDLKFTMEIGGKELCFLDVQISIIENRLETSVYSKPTDSHLYLHATSTHDKSSVNGIPKGVALRLRRLCSTDEEYDKKANEYAEFLELRGYNRKKVNCTFKKIRDVPRSEARKPVVKNQSSTSPIIFATKYNPRGPNVRNIVKQFLPVLQQAPILNELFPDSAIMVANKRENNLADLILRSDPYNIKGDITDQSEHGYVKCARNCDSCSNFVLESTFIESNATKRKFSIRKSSTCTTKNVIYVVCCQSCGKQGVGSTVSWKPRLANYKSHIKNGIKTCRIVRHFVEECVDKNFSNLKFMIVDVVNNTDTLSKDEIENLLHEKEKFWIGTLVTQHQGLNGTHDWSRKKRTEREIFSE